MHSRSSLPWPALEPMFGNDPLIVPPDTAVSDTIARISSAEEDSGVLVVEEGRLVGILTEKAILQAIAGGRDLSIVTVAEIMTPAPLTFTYTGRETILDALSLVQQHHLRYLPVVNGQEEYLGIVTANRLRQAFDLAAIPNSLKPNDRGTKYRSLYDDAPCGYHSLDGEGRVLEMNATELRMLGYQREEIIGRKITDFLPPEGVSGFEESFPLFKRQGWIKDIEHPIYCKDGSILYQNISATAVYDDAGNFLRTRTVAIDVSDRKRLEFALRDSTSQLHRILDQPIISIVSFRVSDNRDWQYEYWSAGCETIFGFTDREFMADKALWLSRVLPKDRETVIQPLLEAFRAERNTTAQYRFRHKDGSLRWISSHYSSQRIEPSGWTITAINYDITQQKQAEDKLRQREEFLSSIYDGADQAIFVIDVNATGDFHYVDFNPVAERYAGCLNANIRGKTPETAFGSKLGAVFRQNYDRCLQAGESVSYEERIAFEKQTIWTLTHLYPLRDARGEIYRLVGTAIDITDRKTAAVEMENFASLLQRQIEREQLIAEITADIRQSLDLTEVLNQTVDRVRQFLHTDRVIIFQFQPDWQGTVVTESIDPEWISLLSTLISDPCFSERYVESYRQGRITAIEDIHTADIAPCYREFLENFQVKANLVVPIQQGQDLWGLLIAHHCSGPRQWRSEEIDLLRQLSNQLDIAIHQSELYQQTHYELMERQRIQAALQESEERFRSLSASAPIGICQTNADGSCLYVNEHWQEMSGLSDVDSLGEGWVQAVHPEDRAALATAWENYLSGNDKFCQDFRLVTPDGRVRWVTSRAAALRSSEGEIIGYVGTEVDITDRVHAEEALRESEQKLQAILDYSPAVIYVVDGENRLLLANRRYAELLSTPVEELLNQSIYERWPEETASAFAANSRKVMETGQRLQVEEVVPQADGLHTYFTIKFPLCDATGQPYAVCGISTDITEKKQLEEQFYRAQRLESLGTLASGIAHDLNNVLTPILAISQTLPLKFPNMDESTMQLLGVLESSAKRGADMVKQILAFSRGQGGTRLPLPVAHLLSEVLRIARRTFPQSIEIVLSLSQQGLWLISADVTQLHQVLMNLMVNARDAMPEGGILTLSAENVSIDDHFVRLNLDARVGNYVALTVADTGTGISPERIDRIFDPFFTTKEMGKGTGLGLATVLGMVKNHGGFIRVSSQIGAGSRFKIYLPAVVETPSPPQPEDPLPRGKGELILVVDDDGAVRESIKAALENAHYCVLLADDGRDAIGRYTKHQGEIQVILMDTMMPDLDGLTAIRTLRKLNPRVKAILTSGLPANRSLARSAGIETFLLKPYTITALLQAVRDTLAADD